MKYRILLSVSLILCLVMLGLACDSGSNPLQPNQNIVRYVSADICVGCHVTVAEEWEDTLHHDALPGLLASDHVAPYCYPCHVVSLDDNPANSGWDDPDPTVAERFGGVQCESCHGAGSQHIMTFEKLPANVSQELCAQCHTGSHHPTFEEWEQSAHAVALSRPAALPYFSVECLDCHSADYIFADTIPESATLDDFEFGITCAVCHDPHSNEHEYQLRDDIVSLCYQCHNHHESVPGEDVHHPNGDMYRGIGGYEYEGREYESSAHTYLADGCAECHMWTSPFNATGQDENAIAGHTFRPVIQACNECHSGTPSFDVYGAQTAIEALLAELEAELDAATENDMGTVSYERALFNWQFVTEDGSLGIHNVKYATALLEDSIEDFEPGS